MRNLSIISIAIVLLTACSGPAPKKNVESAAEIVSLSKQSFLAKVYNYEKNDSWVYEGSKPCIIDFYADWCAPCRKVAPILKELAATYTDDIVVYKIDVDAEEELAALFGIQSIPALLFVPMDGEPQMLVGLRDKSELAERIDVMLSAK
ncbi:MAG: thioredoxin [Tannerellaceae bacterium]|jgi:thioredoxin|nr:thioredoxin [Tannerellaceae bacterium]